MKTSLQLDSAVMRKVQAVKGEINGLVNYLLFHEYPPGVVKAANDLEKEYLDLASTIYRFAKWAKDHPGMRIPDSVGDGGD